MLNCRVRRKPNVTHTSYTMAAFFFLIGQMCWQSLSSLKALCDDTLTKSIVMADFSEYWPLIAFYTFNVKQVQTCCVMQLDL